MEGAPDMLDESRLGDGMVLILNQALKKQKFVFSQVDTFPVARNVALDQVHSCTSDTARKCPRL